MAYYVTALCYLIFILLFTGTFQQDNTENKQIGAYEKNDKLFLKCSYKSYSWKKDDIDLSPEFNDKDLNVGSLWSDPRGVYSCWDVPTDTSNSQSSQHIHVYVRKCQNCIELDTGTISGFLVADVIMIALIAMAVYFVSGSETRRPRRASDKQNLTEEDEDYQMLGARHADPYSQLAPRMKKGAI